MSNVGTGIPRSHPRNFLKVPLYRLVLIALDANHTLKSYMSIKLPTLLAHVKWPNCVALLDRVNTRRPIQTILYVFQLLQLLSVTLNENHQTGILETLIHSINTSTYTFTSLQQERLSTAPHQRGY